VQGHNRANQSEDAALKPPSGDELDAAIINSVVH
jgi:hypothetical protein